jgi:preprotein translocase subunit YajC
MYRKTLIAGGTVAAIVCAGGTALAFTGSDSTSGTPSTTGASAQHSGLHLGRGKLLRRLAHGEFVVRGANGFVTHDVIVGTVTAVSSSSITVRAADNTSETFAITKDTKVRIRSNGSGTTGTISQVADGDHVLVLGTDTTSRTAKHVVDVKQ